jgi:hypothetical protein
MSTTVAKYTFSSWLRKGVGTGINETDNLGNGSPSVNERATIPVDVTINNQNVHNDFTLLGPGDVIGINPSMVVRTEPLNWITNFEPNYLAFIEFYDEDFLWRYTPAKANGAKLRPWIVLLVLKEDEFTREDKTFPLPSIRVNTATALPPKDDTWAWAHVHINEGYDSQTAFEQFLQSLRNLNSPNADKIISRLVSPRKLDPNTAYHAFVVPAFDTGCKAGLGEDTAGIDAQQPAWDNAAGSITFPVYYEWYFRTGENEDFESLVKLLEPRVMDERVGRRDMDGSQPGFGMLHGTDIGQIVPASENQQVIGLEGALKAPSTKSRPKQLDTTRPFFKELKDILNFPAVLQKKTNTAIDPVVSPPIYGAHHALTHEVDIGKNGWLHALNKDPRNRVPGGFGTNVIKENQENYMAKAWLQVQKILEANKKMLFAAFAMNYAERIRMNFISKLTQPQSLLFFSPLLKKVKGSPVTLQQQMTESTLPVAAVSPAFRRLIRPRGAFFKKLQTADPSFNHAKLLNDLNEERVSAAPPKKVPAGILTDEKVFGQLPGNKRCSFFKWLIKNRLWLLLVVLFVLLVIGLITQAWCWVIVGAIAAVILYLWACKWAKIMARDKLIQDPEALVDSLTNAAPRPSFRFSETDPAVLQPAGAGTIVRTTTESTFNITTYYTPTGNGQDSVEARNFREAAIALNKRLGIKVPEQKRKRFDMQNAYDKMMHAVNPFIVFPKQLASRVDFSFNPKWLLEPDHLVPAMAYPDFEDPMYEKLRDISSELLLPNLTLIPQNTISLLVSNPSFIESYMVGLNHEFGKELLWREYPTDTRGSYFRQFWDVKGIISNDKNVSQEQLTENYKDITPIDTWHSYTTLGEHNRMHGKKNMVLVVRGELLKKYPNTIIYAQKAHIYKDPKTKVPDGTKEPIIATIATAADMANEISFPLFKAAINPDYKFFGFDLTVEDAFGDDKPSKESDNWGYYFVIQEIPGELRLGMDITYDPDDDSNTPITWDDMAWNRYAPGEKFIKTTVAPLPSFVLTGPTDTINQWGTDSANMAYILFQKPVMIAVHAKEMMANINP